MPHDDADYYRRRAQQELARADGHLDPMIAQVHRKLAALYEERVVAGSANRLSVVQG